MNPVEQGRFCNSCQKQVTDFTGMSDEKLVAFFRKPDTSVCGRFRKDQLEKDIAVPQKRIPWFKYFFQIALPAVLFSYKGYSQDVYTKGKVAFRPVSSLLEQQKAEQAEKEKCIQQQAPQKRVLMGRVVDAEGNGISFASVWRENSLQGTAADSAGYFRLTINEEDSLVLLKISSVGYAGRTIQFDITKGNAIPAILLERDDLMGVVIVGMVAPVKKKTTMIIPVIMDTPSRHFKVFPNPVLSGSSLNIELTNKLKEGYYNLLVTGLDGKRIFQKEIWIDAEAKVMSIELPSITAGNYILSLKNRKTGKEFGEKLVIQ
jgi:hypothetical protein